VVRLNEKLGCRRLHAHGLGAFLKLRGGPDEFGEEAVHLQAAGAELFGMPLHADQKAAVFSFDALDQAVGAKAVAVKVGASALMP
jgi:hypothetical protein